MAFDSAPGERLADVVYLVDSFPVLSETFVVAEADALTRLGHRVRVESTTRPPAGEEGTARGLEVVYLQDDPMPAKLRDLAAVVARHPIRATADLVSRRRWRREEAVLPLRSLAPVARRLRGGDRLHLHAHFASSAALTALRLSRLLGVPYSVTAHAFDIYREPRNLREKLERAAFATSGCEYTVADLRRLVAPEHAARISKVVMGVEGERFRRRGPHPAGRSVVAVGRLVEKKGFRHLLEAWALLREKRSLERLVIVGDGPLAGELREQAARLGIEGLVEWPGARPHEEVRARLEGSDVLAMPCVIAADGDRDSMPVVVKEALAMEIPVVASDEVGLPELVRPEWGRLVPPGDPERLAAALAELLELPVAERAAMGRAGRRWVLETCSVDAEAERLSRLIQSAGAS